MKKLKNRQIVAMNDFKSEYFEQAVFVLKENVIAENDEMFKEAAKIASRYADKFEKKKQKYPLFFILTSFSLFSGVILLLINFLK